MQNDKMATTTQLQTLCLCPFKYACLPPIEGEVGAVYMSVLSGSLSHNPSMIATKPQRQRDEETGKQEQKSLKKSHLDMKRCEIQTGRVELFLNLQYVYPEDTSHPGVAQQHLSFSPLPCSVAP